MHRTQLFISYLLMFRIFFFNKNFMVC